MADLIIGDIGKFCRKCGTVKPATLEFFSASRRNKCGLASHCKPCNAAAKTAWLSDPDNLSRKRVTDQRYRQDPANRARKHEIRRARHADPARYAKVAATKNKYRSDPVNRAKLADAERAYRADTANRLRRSDLTREHFEKNPHLKLHRSIRSAISAIVRRGKGAFRNLPYTRENLRLHLEKQFVAGMSWTNYGTEWHVDHIQPMASFNIDADDPANCREFQACWALTNLRPLWKRDNLVKNAKRTHLI